jgi:hypothetical protein
MPLSQGPVFQPSAGFSYGGLSLSLWGNFDFDSRLERPGLNEVDVFLTYSWALEGLTIEPGLSLYTYPRQTPGSPGTTEATLYVSVPLAGPVSAYLDQAVDIGAYAGGYFADAGLSLETGVCANVSIEASLSQTFGSTTFNSAYWEISRSMLDACALKLVLTWSLARKLSLSPRLDIVALTSSGLRRAAGRNSYFNLGLTLGVGVE